MLKFITEQILREKYKNIPFDTFTVEDSERLTPGGRQYLLDKKIKIVLKKELEKELNKKQLKKEVNIKEEKIEKAIENEEEKKQIAEIKINRKLLYKLKSIEALFFSLVSENLEKNLVLAQQLLEISRVFRDFNRSFEVGNPIEVNTVVQLLENKGLEIHDIHIHNKNATEIFKLQSVLYEIYFLEEIILSEEEIKEKAQILIQNLRYIEGKILSIIVELLGGEQCQKRK